MLSTVLTMFTSLNKSSLGRCGLSEEFQGYKGEALRALIKAGVDIGDIVRIKKNETVYEGILIPRFEFGDDKHVVIKMKSGYNVGIQVTLKTQIKKIRGGSRPTFIPPSLPEQRSDLPRVIIVSTGGTIASRVDYRTGGVRPALSASDLYSVVPELSEIAVIETEILFSLFSENITPRHWSETAKTVAKHIEEGVAGVVVAHGTDTMGYTGAALSFALQNLSVPVVVVGSQRSADRPSSDAASNLMGAVRLAARAPFAEVVVAMHENISDSSIMFHRGTKVRKCHTSRRDAFRSVNAMPFARVEDESISMLTEEYRKRKPARKLVVKPDFDEKVALLKFHPSLEPKIIDWYVTAGYKGIILEGTGLGHISKYCFSSIKRAINRGMVVAMTSQCIWGRVNMNVYDTGRDLLAMGVIPLEDVLPETALVKLMWVFGSYKPGDVYEAERLMLTNFAGEITPRGVFAEF